MKKIELDPKNNQITDSSISFSIFSGSGPGGIGAGQDAEIDPNALKSLVG